MAITEYVPQVWVDDDGGGTTGTRFTKARMDTIENAEVELSRRTRIVRLASRGNVNVAFPGAVIDGVPLASGDRVLLAGQASAAANGIYLWSASSATMPRAPDFASSGQVLLGQQVLVSSGANLRGTSFLVATETPTIGTTPIAFVTADKSGWATVFDYGAVGDGITDDSAAIQAALTANAGGRLKIVGTFKITTRLQVPARTTVDAYGAKFLPSLADSAVSFASSTPRVPTTTYPLAADPSIGAFTVTVASANAALLSVGQRVQIKDPTYLNVAEATHRELNVIDGVNVGTGVITLRHPVGHLYPVANSSWIAPVQMITGVRWYGGEFDMIAVGSGSSTTDYNCIKGDWAENCEVVDAIAYNFPSKVVDIYAGLNCEIRDCSGHSPTFAGPGKGYVSRLNYCRDSVIEGGWSQNVRHHADIVGGHSCGIIGGRSAGRTVATGADTNTGAYLHGCESRWCYIKDFKAENLAQGAGAGNGSFTGDYDFTIEDVAANGCDTSVLSYKSTGRIVRPFVRNPTGDAIVATNVGTDVDVVDPDIDMGTTSFKAVATTGLLTGNRYRVSGGTIKYNNGAASPVQLSVPAGAEFLLEGTTFEGTMLRSVYLSGSSVDQTVRGAKFKCTVGEAIRADAGEIRAYANQFCASATTAIRAAVSCSKVTQDGNDWNGATNRIGNTSSAVVVGTTKQELESTAAPTAGTWAAGDRCWNSAPVAAGVPGWVCVTPGTPGTWKAMAAVAA